MSFGEAVLHCLAASLPEDEIPFPLVMFPHFQIHLSLPESRIPG